jgi:hypothetical protein
VKLLIVQGCNRNAAWFDLAQYTSRLNFDWAKRQENVDVLVSTFPETDRPAAWSKLILLNDIIPFSDYDYILWVDADCIIHPSATISDFLPEIPIKFRICVDVCGYNTGTICFPNNLLSNHILTHWYQSALPDEINHGWWEQQTFHRLVRNKDETIITNLDENPIDCKKVIHASGVNIQDKMETLKTRYSECF